MEDVKKEDKMSVRKNVGITMLCVCFALLIFSIFGIIGGLKAFLLGAFGFMLYPLLVLLCILSVALIKGMKLVYPPRYLVYLGLCFFFFICVLHICFTGFGSASQMSYGEYLSAVYSQRFTPGGVLVGVFTFPLIKLLHAIAGIVIYGIALIICIYFVTSFVESVRQKRQASSPKERYKGFDETISAVEFDKLFNYEEEKTEEKAKPIEMPHKIVQEESIFVKDEEEGEIEDDEVTKAKERLGLTAAQEENEEKEENIKNAEQRLFSTSNQDEWQNRGMNKIGKYVYEEEKVEKRSNPILERNKEYLSTLYSIQSERDNPIINAEDYDDYKRKMQEFNERKNVIDREENWEKPHNKENDLSLDIEPRRENDKFRITDEYSADSLGIERDKRDDDFYGRQREINRVDANNTFSTDEHSRDYDIEDDDFITDDGEDDDIDYIRPQSFEEKNNEEYKSEFEIKHDYRTDESSNDLSGSLNNTFKLNTAPRNFNFEVINGPVEEHTEPDFSYSSSYVRPPIDLLNVYQPKIDASENVERNIEALERVLEEFGVPAKVEDVRRGAAVTRYELRMPVGITVRKVEAHASDIALALAARSSIRIEAPIKGKSAVGIEVPNNSVDTVGLRDVICSDEFMSSKNPLNFALGKDVDGNVKCCNLAKMPHLLVAGSTNSGKSVCLNTLIVSLIYHTSPEDLRIILVDPKQVEFTIYNNLPHMLLPKAVVDAKKVMNTFDWLVGEMERRYTIFRDNLVRDLGEYNRLPDVMSKKLPKLPSIVLIVDELADLVVTLNRKELDERIIRLTQKARAAGIHIILATQRPSVDIITGVIKVNLPSRIAFAVTSSVDSKTILGTGGAENLLGRGDMLYSPCDGEPVRVQGAFVDTSEVKAVVEFIKSHNESHFDENIAKAINGESAPQGGGSYNASAQVDSLMQDALKVVIENGQASSSMLQRRFAIGFQRASKIIDQMEMAGFISPSDGSKARTVYITMDDYNKLYGG